MQGVGDWGVDGWDGVTERAGRLRMRTLVTLRWMIIAGEALLFFFSCFLLGFEIPYALCFAVIGASAWINLLTGVASPGQRLIGGWEAVAQLSFDIAQISILLS